MAVTTNLNKKIQRIPIAKTCRYCGNDYIKKDGEHVFPYGLGGEDLFMDCVCPKCNNYFSGLELELYQKSFVGLLRSTMGLEGYEPNPRNPAPFKAPLLLSYDRPNNTVIEMGQYHQMRVFVRPQIYTLNNTFYVEADSLENRQLFTDAFVKWKKTNGVMTARENGKIIQIKFTLADCVYTQLRQPLQSGIKNPIQYNSLPEDHKLYPFLAPRLFMDDDGGLKIRAKTLAEAENFLEAFLNDTLSNNRYSSFKELDLSSPVVHVGFSFDGVKLQQALVKIGLNCVFHYYPAFKNHTALDPYTGYVMDGTHGIRGGMEQKDAIIDTVDETHNIFISQWEGNVRIRISLFNGQFAFAFWIENLPLLGKNTYDRLVIDYKNRHQIFQDTMAFFQSFPVGSPKIEEIK